MADHAAYRAAVAADDAFQRELVRVYGESAGDMRYKRGKYTDARLQAASERKLAADRVMRGERSPNAPSIRYTKRARPTLAPLEPDSRIRWETKHRIGQAGAVYEFNVKLPRIPEATFTEEDLYIERDIALMVFKDLLKQDFKWVGDVYFTGRSSGWLAVEAGKGGATQKQILDIADRVDDARDEFVRYLREEYS